jgi:hypothetical protein
MLDEGDLAMNSTPTAAPTLSLSKVSLRMENRLGAGETPAIRRYFGQEFEDQVLIYNRGPNDDLLYQYPRVQFKVIDDNAVLVGVKEGSELLQQVWRDYDRTCLGGDGLRVVEARIESHEEPLMSTDEPLEYRFVTPWIALNQKNFGEYTSKRNPHHRKQELSRILTGNCLGLAKSLGIRFSDRVTADCSRLTSIKASPQGSGMIGFVGRFTVNVTLPDDMGLGKSVARGFGTVQKISTR